MTHSLDLRNTDTSKVRKSIIAGSVVTFLTFLALGSAYKNCESCLTNNQYLQMNCHLRFSSPPLIPMFMPSLLLNIVLCLTCMDLFSSICNGINKFSRRVYWNVKNQFTGSDSKYFIKILEQYGNLAKHKFADGKEKPCIVLEGFVNNEQGFSNIEFVDAKTYIFLAPAIFSTLKNSIERRENLKNSGLIR